MNSHQILESAANRITMVQKLAMSRFRFSASGGIKENHGWFYRTFVMPNLFGEWTLLREWGRIEQGDSVDGVDAPPDGIAMCHCGEC